VIAVQAVDIAQDDGALTVAVSYVVTRTQENGTATFTRSTS
jgi:hypothetical protein